MMKVVIQRVSKASVVVDSKTVGSIGKGLLVYVGVSNTDKADDALFIGRKIAELRLFEDDSGKMNRSVCETRGAVLIISNFTLQGNCRKGRRPSFDSAARPDEANELYEKVIDTVKSYGLAVEKGTFRAHMHVESINDGPVTLLIDSELSRSKS
jgi:D-tyrosyl-tRNA(Tyr) deacylase